MPGGRPSLGSALVDTLEGPAEVKTRLKTILDVLAKRTTVDEACAVLRVSRSYYYLLQTEALNGALDALLPKPPGRPPAEKPQEDPRVRALQERVADLEVDLAAARVREEIATTLPHFAARQKKKRRKKLC
jgi:hypothetical protein